MPLPFFITYEHPTDELVGIVESSFSLFESLGNVTIPRQHFGNGPWKQGEYGSFDWYLQQAFDSSRGQISSEKLWDLFLKEPFQKTQRHYELAVLDTDIFTSGTNFVYGVTRPQIFNNGGIISDGQGEHFRVSGLLQSTHRMKEGFFSWQKYFQGILIHEMGHFFGLASTQNPNYLGYNDPRAQGYLDINHCDDRSCIMEQVDISGRPTLSRKVDFVTSTNPLWFCKSDVKALRTNLQNLYGGQ